MKSLVSSMAQKKVHDGIFIYPEKYLHLGYILSIFWNWNEPIRIVIEWVSYN